MTIPKITLVTYDSYGHTGSGFSFESLSLIHKKLREIEIPYCPVDYIPYLNRETVWKRPITVVEVKFNNWTYNKIMRVQISKN